MLRSLSLFFALCLGAAFAQTVRFSTNLGDIDVLLLPGTAPKTVENFLRYMNKGAYNNSVIHRSVPAAGSSPAFIFQGGGFQATLPSLPAIAQDAAVVNEYSLSNVRGTIAMAKVDGNPDSATNQWFFNLSDNGSILNGQNGGFTVFGRIVDSASLAIMDKIAKVPVPSPAPLLSPFDQIPLQNYSSGAVATENLVVVKTITQVPTLPPPAIADGGILTAGSFGAYPTAAPGSYLEIYGGNLAEATREWGGEDFTATGGAPTVLEGVSVTVGGQRAFISYVSPTQVNVQVPSTVVIGISLPVVLTYKAQTTGQIFLTIRPRAGGLFAPPAFKVGSTQYVYAAHADGSIVSNGTIPGVAVSPARSGETLIFYGIGFGDVVPFSTPIAGRIVNGLSSLAFPVQFKFGASVAQTSYAGLAPGFVGLYQFNVIVPSNLTNGDVAVEVTQNNEAIAQPLFIPVQN